MGTLKHDGPPPERVRILLSAGKRDPDVREWLWRHVRSAQSEIRSMIRERIAAESGTVLPEAMQGRLPIAAKKDAPVAAVPLQKPSPPSPQKAPAPASEKPATAVAPTAQPARTEESITSQEGQVVEPGSPASKDTLNKMLAELNKRGRASDSEQEQGAG